MQLANIKNISVIGAGTMGHGIGLAYAWGGFGAAFGPLVLFALFSRRTTWLAALLGMVTGAVVLVVWKEVGLSSWMYEIVPGFAANCITMWIVNLFIPQTNTSVLEQFQEVRKRPVASRH